MLVGKVVGQEEEIKAQVYLSTNDTCKQVYELIQTKALVNRVTCKLKRISSHLEAGETQNSVELH